MTSFADDDDDHDDKKEGSFLVVAVISSMVMKWIMPVIMMMKMMVFAKNICPPFPPPRAEGAFGFLLDHLDPRSSCTEIQ